MNINRAKKYLRKKGVEQQRIEMPNGGIQLHNLLADFEQYCLSKVKESLIDEIEIKQGSDGEPRYILTQKQFDKL